MFSKRNDSKANDPNAALNDKAAIEKYIRLAQATQKHFETKLNTLGKRWHDVYKSTQLDNGPHIQDRNTKKKESEFTIFTGLIDDMSIIGRMQVAMCHPSSKTIVAPSEAISAYLKLILQQANRLANVSNQNSTRSSFVQTITRKNDKQIGQTKMAKFANEMAKEIIKLAKECDIDLGIDAKQEKKKSLRKSRSG